MPPEGGALSPELRGPRCGSTLPSESGGEQPTVDIDASRAGGAPIAWPGDSRAALRRVVDALTRPCRRRRADACPTACPATVTVERPRQKEHGDYATNVALQLAKPAGLPPRDARRARSPSGCGRPTASPRSTSPAPGSSTSRVDAGAQGAGRRGTIVGGRARRTARSDALAGEQDQPRVRLGQPDRPDAPRRRPLGGGRRRARPGARGDRRRGRPGSTTSTTPARRSTGSPARCWPRPGASRRPRTATAATTSTTSPTRSSPSDPDVLGPARRRGAGGLPRRGRRADVRRDQGEPARLRRRLRRLLPRERPARARRGRRGDRSGSTRARATSTSRTARCGCAPTDFGDDKDRVDHQVRRRAAPTSPATSPTTSTSASAASTAASTCSAPTTTATSAG